MKIKLDSQLMEGVKTFMGSYKKMYVKISVDEDFLCIHSNSNKKQKTAPLEVVKAIRDSPALGAYIIPTGKHEGRFLSDLIMNEEGSRKYFEYCAANTKNEMYAAVCTEVLDLFKQFE